MRLAIITGISRGLGESIWGMLTKENVNILGLGRDFTEEQLTYANRCSEKNRLFYCDLSSDSDLELLESLLSKQYLNVFHEIIFISNAGVIKPIKKIGEFGTIQEISNIITTNYISNIIIVNLLMKNKSSKTILRILNISSGASERPISGWSLYCSSKKAIKSFLDVLCIEHNNVIVHNIDPGVMDTEMQNVIRQSSSNDFPDVDKFKRFKDDGELKSPSCVASRIIKDFIK